MNWKDAISYSILIMLLLSLNPAIVFSDSYNNVDVSQAKEMVDSNPDLVILDVRTWNEYINGHIKHATLIPVTELESRLGELDSQKPTLVYGGTDGGNSTASRILVDNGFVEVYNMLGGIAAWIAAGYPIVQIEVPKDYATIQAAINAANIGDTILVSPGTYYEHVVVNKTVRLMGEDPETTFIDGSGTQTILKIVIYDVNVTRFTFQNGGLGVYLTIGTGSCIVTDCKIVNNNLGIYVISDNNILAKNIIANNSESGVEVYASCGCSPVRNNIIKENTLSNNKLGIQLINSAGGQIYGNNFLNNVQQVYTFSGHNNWDNEYPSGGNYWSDYSGTDMYSGLYQNEAGYDWIGDTPYIIDKNNQDNYPLMDTYDPKTEEVLDAYRELLGRYNELQSTFNNLNSTYHSLLAIYNELLVDFDNLNTTQYEAITNYNSLNSSYSNLNATYNDLESQQKATINELSNIRNIMYVLMLTTVVLVATTGYLVIRKPKTKP